MQFTSLLKRLPMLAVLSICALRQVGAQTSINVNPSVVQLASQPGNTTPVTQSVTVTGSGAATAFQVNATGGPWLSVTPVSGTTPLAILVSANAASLAAGSYIGNVQIIAAATNSPVNIPVTFIVSGGSSQLV